MFITGDRKFSMQSLQPSLRVQAEPTAFDMHRKELALVTQNAGLPNSGSIQASRLDDKLNTMEDNGIVLDQEAEDTWLIEKSGVDFGEKFLKLSEMTIAERLRYFFLEDREMTEDDLEAMSQKDRQAIEDQIRQMIMAALGWDDDEYDAAFGKYLSSQGDAGSAVQEAGVDIPHDPGQGEQDPIFALFAITQASPLLDNQ